MVRHDLADLYIREVGLEVIVAHPESAIISLGIKSKLLFKFICPVIRIIAPSSFPLKLSPGVSELKELDIVSIPILNLLCRKDAISMSSNKSQFFKSCLICIICSC